MRRTHISTNQPPFRRWPIFAPGRGLPGSLASGAQPERHQRQAPSVALDYSLGHCCLADFRKNSLLDHSSPDRPRLLWSNTAGGKETSARLSSTTCVGKLPELV